MYSSSAYYFTIFFSLLFLFLFSSPCLAFRTTPFWNLTLDRDLNNHTHDAHDHPWFQFEKLIDARRGSHVSGISELKTYFHRFGYLEKKKKMDSFNDTFDEQLEHALGRYQENLGLPVTRNLDSDTISQIMSPRCGFSDKLHATKHYTFFDNNPRWSREIPMTLTYAFSPVYKITSLSMADIRAAFGSAFSHWASVIPVGFVETEEYEWADIKIGFYSGDHGDDEPFDGVLGVLAHAFAPENGNFHLDAAEKWAVDLEVERSKVAVDLESIATHEIGHLLGLGHTSVKEAVMYPTLKARHRRVKLKLDDVRAVQALYGSNPNFSYGTLTNNNDDDDQSDISSGDRGRRCLRLMMLAVTTLFMVSGVNLIN